MSQTARLNLPLIQPAQAQKHITHNEALALLDGLAQLCLKAVDQDTPPQTAQEGEVYGIGPAPVAAWAGQAGALALYAGGGWSFVAPQPGWRAWDLSTAQLMIHGTDGWQAYAPALQNLATLGIGATADANNPLIVAAPASLFTHVGGGHQIKVNKADVADTASLLFQSNWTGHAEMGLAGETAFAIKVSADGANWVTALRADAGQGAMQIDLPVSGQAVQQSADDTTAGRLMRADWGYGPGNVLGPVAMAGTVPSGAVIERGETAAGQYVKWADGTQICWGQVALARLDAGTLEAIWTVPAAFAGAATVTVNLSDETTTSVSPRDLTGPFAAETTAGVRLRLYAASGVSGFVTGDAATAQVIAIGRWI